MVSATASDRGFERYVAGMQGARCGGVNAGNAGLELRQLVAASGSVKLLPGLSQLLDVPEGRHHLLSVLRLLEAEPSLIGMSQNFVAIAQAPAGN